MNPPPYQHTTQLTNRLLDEGVMLIVKTAHAEGISISPKTALRWCIGGLRGVRLESLRIAGQRMTSRQALRRFIAATQDRPAATQPAELCPDREAADRILEAHGLGRSECAKRGRRVQAGEGESTP